MFIENGIPPAEALPGKICEIIGFFNLFPTDQGDGRWKERDKENFQHDIILFKKIAGEKINVIYISSFYQYF